MTTPSPPFITHVALRNYKSIGSCSVRLSPLNYLVGPNGAGKSNFMDALQFVRDALANSLDSALNERGGINEVRRRYGSPNTHLAVRIDFVLPGGDTGHYTFGIGALKNGGYEVQKEECIIKGIGQGPSFIIEKGKLVCSSELAFPAITSDRLALVAASGLKAFRPVFDALTTMGFYNLNPKLMRELQKPQSGRLLRPAGENIASVIGHLEKVASSQFSLIQEYLHAVVPNVHGVNRKSIGPMETLEFHEDTGCHKIVRRLMAQNMSDGTLRALGVLAALMQRTVDYAPTFIGIEEPETSLHPSAIVTLRKALKKASKTTQILLTTHSQDLLDDFDINANTVLNVALDAGETRFAPSEHVHKVRKKPRSPRRA